jgi:adenylate cyclase
MPTIHYLPDNRSVELDAENNETILRASLRHEIPHTRVCGGRARCSTCRVLVLEGLEHCPPRNEREQAMASKLHFPSNIRLACQTAPTGNVNVRRLVIDAEDIELTSQLREGATVNAAVGEEKELAILFSDIRGFTSFVENLPPYDVIHVLNRYFNHMGHVIAQHGGSIYNYMGDGLMALFGMEQSESAALNAIKAGLAMLQAMEEFKSYLQLVYGRVFDIGIGVHYGMAVVGALGASDSQKITAIGDAVNYASRIESANKEAGTRFLISEETYTLVKNEVLVNRWIRVTVKGKTGEYLLYEVIGLAQPSNPLPSKEGLKRDLEGLPSKEGLPAQEE